MVPRLYRSLSDFLLASRNSRYREFIARSRFEYEITLASAKRTTPMDVLHGAVDEHGHDVVISNDIGEARRIQLKSHYAHAKKDVWQISALLLLPDRQSKSFANFCGNEGALSGWGGAFVIQDLHIHDSPADMLVSYRLTDFETIMVLYPRLLTSLRKARDGGQTTVLVPAKACWPPVSAEILLWLLGMHSPELPPQLTGLTWRTAFLAASVPGASPSLMRNVLRNIRSIIHHLEDLHTKRFRQWARSLRRDKPPSGFL